MEFTFISTVLIQNSEYEISQQHRGPQRNRKQARKQERAQQKQRKAEFFSNKRQAETEHQDSPQRKRLKPQPAEPRLLPTKVTPKPPPSRPAKVKTKATKKPLPKQRDNEDEYIAYLEGQLGYKSGKTSRNDDGLDGACAIVQPTKPLMISHRSSGFYFFAELCRRMLQLSTHPPLNSGCRSHWTLRRKNLSARMGVTTTRQAKNLQTIATGVVFNRTKARMKTKITASLY